MKTGHIHLLEPRLLIISIYSFFIAALFGLYAAIVDASQISLRSLCASIFSHWDIFVSAIFLINVAVCFVVVYFVRKMAASAFVMPMMLIEFLLMSLAYAALSNPY